MIDEHSREVGSKINDLERGKRVKKEIWKAERREKAPEWKEFRLSVIILGLPAGLN
jgi:hypothetical protein